MLLDHLFHTSKNSEKIHAILKNFWGYDAFRPLQEEIILSILDGKDTLALLPTGGGKSICFQVPALAMEGICIVVSPLIALMKDQVENLKKRGIKAEAIYTGKSQHEIDLIINNAVFDKDFKFLYISPERLKTDRFRLNVGKMKVAMFAIDEAHCISQWGYDFRPPYLAIAEIRQYFPKAPFLALTATATPEVVSDIQKKLGFKKENVFKKSFRRENLTYFVVKEEDKNGRLLRILQKYPGTGVVYVRNRKKTQEVAEFLQRQGIAADYYHAGLDSATRDRRQNDWMQDRTRVIVATNAFGMGIDKPQVRFVVHLDLPDTLEAYFQEAGRGGRDERPAVAILLYDQNDIRELKRNFALSFPGMDYIRKIYALLCQHYAIPLGAGKGYAGIFEMWQFAHKYNLNITQLYTSIQLLVRAGFLTYLDQDDTVSVLQVLCTTRRLEEFEKQSPDLAEFLKVFMRSYPGLFSDYVRINEAEIAKRLDIAEEQVVEKLKILHKMQLVTYRPKTMKPMLIFLENRIREQYLQFSKEIYQFRKEVAEKHLKAVLDYIADAETCRSQLLLRYFGEKKSPACGKCDVCLRKRKMQIGNDFQAIAQALQKLSQERRHNVKTLVNVLSDQYPEEKVIETLRWLVENGKIDIDR